MRNVNGGKYIKIGECRLLETGQAEYFPDANYRALKVERSEERPEKHYQGSGAENLSGERLKVTVNNIERETNKVSLLKAKTQERA